MIAITKQKEEHAMKNPALLKVRTYLGRDEAPEDFDAFWDEEVKSFLFQPAQLEERFHIPQVKCYELNFEGFLVEERRSTAIVPSKSEEKVPLIFHFHGYMGGRGWDWADMLAYTCGWLRCCFHGCAGPVGLFSKTACTLSTRKYG